MMRKQVWEGSYNGNLSQVYQVGAHEWELVSWDINDRVVHDARFDNEAKAIDVGHNWLWDIAEVEQGWQ